MSTRPHGTPTRAKLLLQAFANNASTAIAFLLSLILSRLLTPTEIGIFSMAAVMVALAHVFRDFGVVTYLRTAKDLSDDDLRAASGLLWAASIAVAATIALLSPWIARLLGHPETRNVLLVLALGFVFIPIGAIPGGLLARRMAAATSARIGLASSVLYLVISVALALAGAGYMTMAWANVANILITGLLMRRAEPTASRLRPSLRGWGKITNFSFGVMLTSTLRALDNAFADVVLGRLTTAAQVGFFSRAQGAVNLINTATSPTIYYFVSPHLARVHHQDEGMAAELTRILAYLTSFIWPLLGLMAVVSTDLIAVLYGPQWGASAPAVPYLCLAGMMVAVGQLITVACVSGGRPHLPAAISVFSLVTKAGLVALFFDGSLISFARIFALAECLTLPMYAWLARSYLRLGLLPFSQAIAASGALTLAVAAAGWAVGFAVHGFHPMLRIGLVSLTVAVVWLGLVEVAGPPIRHEVRVARGSLLARWRRRQGSGGDPA